MYEGNSASAIGPRQTSAPASVGGPSARVTSAVEMAINHNAQVASDIREAVLELRGRLASVLPAHAHQEPPPQGPNNGKIEPPPVPVVQFIEEITATQHRTLDVLRTILQHVAL